MDIEDLEQRKLEFGTNHQPERETSTLFSLIMECFEDLML